MSPFSCTEFFALIPKTPVKQISVRVKGRARARRTSQPTDCPHLKEGNDLVGGLAEHDVEELRDVRRAREEGLDYLQGVRANAEVK